MGTFKFRRVLSTIALSINLVGAGSWATTTTGFAQTGLSKPLAAPTQTPVPKATTATTHTIQSATIVNYTNASLTGQLVIGLSIDFPYGQTLSGSELNAFLAAGVIEVKLPNGTVKSFSGVPPADPNQAGVSFRKFDPKATGGIEIAVYLGKALGKVARGKYQVVWRSRDVVTPEVNFNWDGRKVIFEEPYEAINAQEFSVDLVASMKYFEVDAGGNITGIDGTITRMIVGSTPIELVSNEIQMDRKGAFVMTRSYGKIKLTVQSYGFVIWLTPSQKAKLKALVK